MAVFFAIFTLGAALEMTVTSGVAKRALRSRVNRFAGRIVHAYVHEQIFVYTRMTVLQEISFMRMCVNVCERVQKHSIYKSVLILMCSFDLVGVSVENAREARGIASVATESEHNLNPNHARSRSASTSPEQRKSFSEFRISG